MYGFRHSTDLSSIVGRALTQTCLGHHEIQLIFSGSKLRYIEIESKLDLFENGALIATWISENNWSDASFQKIVNAEVTNVTLLDHGSSLAIAFKDNLELRMYDNSDSDESVRFRWLDGSYDFA